MASASVTVVENLRLDALPLIDLHLLSQSELYSLSLCSSSSYASSSYSNDNDDVLIPKIDRSVFNESAGSRKQTYSRLRLAPRKPHSPSTHTTTTTPNPIRSSVSSIPRHIPEPLDDENSQIISLLKQLFATETPAETPAIADHDDLFSVRVDFEEPLPDLFIAGMQDVPIEVVVSGGGGGGEEKRKRGRPRKHDNCITERKAESKAEPRILVNVALGEGVKKRKRGRPRKNETHAIQGRQSEREMALVDKNVEEKEMVMVNEKGEMVDAAALGNVEDPYGEELKRRTEGLQTKAELLGFLTGLSGEWWSKSRKKRVVLASDFGHAFPKGWKLMLSVKKRADRVWLHCRRYIRFL